MLVCLYVYTHTRTELMAAIVVREEGLSTRKRIKFNMALAYVTCGCYL